MEGRWGGIRQSGGRRKSQDRDWQREMVTVFVGNIALDEEGGQLAGRMGKVARVADWVIPVRKTQCIRWKFGFFRFKDYGSAHAVIKDLNGLEWKGRRLWLNWGNPRRRRLGRDGRVYRGKTVGSQRKGNFGVGAALRDNRSYAQVVRNQGDHTMGGVVDKSVEGRLDICANKDSAKSQCGRVRGFKRDGKEVSRDAEDRGGAQTTNPNAIRLEVCQENVGWLRCSAIIGIEDQMELQKVQIQLYDKFAGCLDVKYAGGSVVVAVFDTVVVRDQFLEETADKDIISWKMAWDPAFVEKKKTSVGSS